jgi:hypothetical protein
MLNKHYDRRGMREWRHSPTYSSPKHETEVSGQLYFPAYLLLWNEPRYPFSRRMCGPQGKCGHFEDEKYVLPLHAGFTALHSLVTKLIELSGLYNTNANTNTNYCYYYLWLCSPARAMASCGSAAQRGLWPPRFTRFLYHTRRATAGRTPLDEWSPRRRYLYLTTHNTHNRQTSMPPVGFEPTIAAGERP